MKYRVSLEHTEKVDIEADCESNAVRAAIAAFWDEYSYSTEIPDNHPKFYGYRLCAEEVEEIN